jgi:lipopolysaccharide/colanic/teichoic acid biosynthesis glycosyltransferase
MKKSRGFLVFSLALIIGDIAAILGAYSLAYILRVKLSDAPVVDYIPAGPYFFSLLVLIPLVVLLFSLLGSYAASTRVKKSVQLTRILVGALGAMLLLITVDYFSLEPIFPAKLVPLYGFLFSIGLILIVRGGLYAVRGLWWRRDHHRKAVVIVGDNIVARGIARSVDRKNSGYRVQAVVGDGRLRYTTHSTFAEAVKGKVPDVIIQVATSDSPTVNADLLRFALEHYIDFKFVPSDVNDFPDRVELELFMGDVPVLNIQQTKLVGWGRLAKRLFDFVFSVLALIVLSPLLLIVALLNRIILGKALFHQTRLTRGNQKFQLYKFQTVRKDLNGLSPEKAFEKIGRPELIKKYRDNGDFLPNDPRYGAWARFLRKSSLDELPQLWNVVKGDISIIGPRALIPAELEAFTDKHLILNVRSGITGLAQISGRRDLPWEQRRKLDVYYVQNWSFGLDLQILISTAWQVLTGRGAQ